MLLLFFRPKIDINAPFFDGFGLSHGRALILLAIKIYGQKS
jgi:hypothetical protein